MLAGMGKAVGYFVDKVMTLEDENARAEGRNRFLGEEIERLNVELEGQSQRITMMKTRENVVDILKAVSVAGATAKGILSSYSTESRSRAHHGPLLEAIAEAGRQADKFLKQEGE